MGGGVPNVDIYSAACGLSSNIKAVSEQFSNEASTEIEPDKELLLFDKECLQLQ
jgi:hypothetical protein